MSFDSKIAEWFESIPRNSPTSEAMVDIAFLGSYPVLVILIIFATMYLYLQKEYQKTMVFVTYVVASIFIFEAIRVLFNIPHPPDRIVLVVGQDEHPVLIGHAIMSMPIYLILAHALNLNQKRFLIIFGFSSSLLVSICRVAAGIQLASQTLICLTVGIILGCIYGLINNHLEKQSRSGKWSDSETHGVLGLHTPMPPQ
jgi:glucose-6-phosphate-specific signal transduction histidine kinase